jgi:hypothetical protein
VDEPDDIDETVVWVRARGPQPLPLDGWDQASVWGWDESTASLFAHLWRNTDDPATSPTVRIEPDDYTPPIPFCATLAQHIAISVECSPWTALAALYEVADQDVGWRYEYRDAGASKGGTVVTMTEGHRLPEWPYRP